MPAQDSRRTHRVGLPRRAGRAVAAVIGLALGLGLAGGAAVAASDPGLQCDIAAAAAAGVTGVPQELLRAIARVETGRHLGGQEQPWPWAVNMQGQGHWFDSRSAAAAFARQHHAAGARSFDIGCFQLNHRWHGDAFDSIDAMFDPGANALYAARFLLQLKQEFGTWDAAAGAYHSRSPELSARYLERVRSRLARPAPPASPTVADPAPGPDPARDSRVTWMQPGAPGQLGSLIPAAARAAHGAFITPRARALQ